jgi:Kef-type K+ transport system membrane component KefB
LRVSEIDLSGLVIVGAVAFTAPVFLGLVPAFRLPAVVLELVAGIVVGPSVLGWVEVDVTIEVLALLGLAFLLFLSGLEIDFDGLRGRRLSLAGLGFAASFGLALVVAFALEGLGQVDTPLFVAIVLVATSLGVVVPVLKDSGNASTELGQLVIAGASIADFGAVILLSLFFSSSSPCSSSSLSRFCWRSSGPSIRGGCRRRSHDSRTRPRRSGSAGRSCSCSRWSPSPRRSGSR